MEAAQVEKPGRVIVIGLDGADWRLLQPWLHAGHLPTLARLVRGGVHGPLRSTIRPESSLAWSSFSTGVNPGKHGVFGFVEQVKGSYSFQLANGASIRTRRFWDFLGEAGLQVGLLNIPFTYPPSAVNGFMVTGMLTPGPDVDFAHPPELQQQLLSRFGKYRFDVDHSTHEEVALIDSVRMITEQQRDTALLLLRERPWRFFTVVFTGPDRLQHFLWAHNDPRHPFYNVDSARLFGSALLEHYQLLDEAIAEILGHLPPDTLLLLMSDHGFNGCARRFYINRWLQERGLLVLHSTSTRRSRLTVMTSYLKSVGWLRRLKRALLPARWNSTSLHSAVFTHAVDWSRTRAYFGLDGGLRINLESREPGGIVRAEEFDALREELRQELLAVEDPETRQPVLTNLFYREELYHGPFAARAPDLIPEPQRDNPDPAHNIVLDGSLDNITASPFASSIPYTANHTLDGVFIAWGAGVAGTRQVLGAQIVDLAPTILAALDVPIPAYMDGRVLSEIFLPGCIPEPRHSEASEPGVPDGPEGSYSLAEEIAVESRLRGLGYLD